VPDLAFVLTNSTAAPEPARIVEAAKALGLDLRPTGDSPSTFEIDGGGAFIVMLVEAPHPDAPEMAYGPTSPDPDEAAAAQAHFILTALGLEGTPRERDTKMAALAATVIRNTDAVGAMLGHGVVFHKPGLFADMAELGMEEGELPAELAVDVTAAAEPDDRMSFLTHGMRRHGREEFYVTCPIQGRGALGFVFSMVRWMLDDRDKQLPTGDTVGRSADERLVVQRVPNPTGSEDTVIRLDLPDQN
jgi:hypothetical protein